MQPTLNWKHRITYALSRRVWAVLMLSVVIGSASGYYLATKYIASAWNGASYYADHMVYHAAAVRTLENPKRLYHNGANTFKTGGTFNYPPPAVLPYMLLAGTSQRVSYVVAVFASLACSLCLTLLVVSMFGTIRGAALTPDRVILGLAVWAMFMPIWQDAKHGQVNAFVALTCMAYVFFTLRKRPLLAAVLLMLGFWAKLYAILILVPIVPFLLHQSLRSASREDAMLLMKTIVYPIAGMALTVIVFLPWLPWTLYEQYVSEVFPMLSAYTGLNPLNQSIAGGVARAITPMPDLADTSFLLMPNWMRVMQMLLLGGASVVAAYYGWRASERSMPFVAVGFLAAIPLVSAYGWEYTYVFTLPLLLVVVEGVYVRGKSIWLSVAVIAVVILFAIPKPTDSMLRSMQSHDGINVQSYLFSIRWIVASAMLMYVGWRHSLQYTLMPEPQFPQKHVG